MALEKNVAEKTLRLVQDDITSRRVDVIVNAANSYLQHCGGVAAAILQKGGKKIQEESNKIGFVPVGSAVKTISGNLPCKAVIHTVGPKMGEGNEDKKLKKAIQNSLLLASTSNFSSISLPAVSSGIFGIPKKRCAEIILRQAKEFIERRPDSSLKIIEVCIFDNETYRHFEQVFSKL